MICFRRRLWGHHGRGIVPEEDRRRAVGAPHQARDLDALEFAADGRDVSIRVRSNPHGSLYPPLADILASIGRTCHDQGVALPQLSRIAFLCDEVRVELGDAGQHPAKVYRFPIEGVLGAPTPERSPLQLVAARLARTGD